MRHRLGRLLAPVGLLLAGCSEESPRPQVLLYVDLDMPVASQIGPDVSPDAAVDTLRIELYGAERRLLDDRMLVVATAGDLPLSLGIPSEASADGQVVVRIRAFRALFATPGEQAGEPVLDPAPEVTIDRAVTLELPSDGIETRSVTLHGECIGLPVHFGIGGQPDHSCIDGDHPDGLSTDGIASEQPSASVAGSWPRAITEPCPAEPPAGIRCVPGGLTILGDPLFQARSELDYDSIPLRVVSLSPFYLDESEVTVGELRQLVAAGFSALLPDAPDPANPARRFCTWDESSSADQPVNCLARETGDAICQAKNGEVPSEAQWEHAARGRGERRLYPWGNSSPECCTTSISRVSGGACPGSGTEPVRSHLGSDTCQGDVSRDGIADLAGSVAELMRDSVSSFADPCWTAPGPTAILQDPVCSSSSSRLARGASWGMVFGDASLPIRRMFVELDHDYGVRCAYEVLP
jgi:formylglycine-generating enzyme required for sulfatase activity